MAEQSLVLDKYYKLSSLFRLLVQNSNMTNLSVNATDLFLGICYHSRKLKKGDFFAYSEKAR